MELNEKELKDKGFDTVYGEVQGTPKTEFMQEVSDFTERMTDMVSKGTGKSLICIAVDTSLGDDHIQTSQTSMGDGLLMVSSLIEYSQREGTKEIFRQAVHFLSDQALRKFVKKENN